MQRQRKLFLTKAAVLLAAPVVMWSFASGPDPGHTGAPTEAGTCVSASCHAGTLNSGPGSVSISFANGATTYTPGQTLRVTVRVQETGRARWGFQMTSRTASATPTQAGTFTSSATIRLTCSDSQFIENNCSVGPRQYVSHRSPLGGAGAGEFTFEWTAPASDVGPVTFYAAGNAANGDGSNSGDRIYTTSATLTPNAPGPSISANGVVSAASFRPGIAAASYVSIFGQNLATTTLNWDNAFTGNQLPRSLGGTTVRINGKVAYPSFVSPTQVNVLAPADSALGPVTVTVATEAGTSTEATVTLQSVAPAFFIFKDNYIAGLRQDFSFLGHTTLFPGLTTPARPGEVVQLYGTGFGPTDPPLPDGQLVTAVAHLSPAANISARVGPQSAVVLFAGAVPPFANLFQVNIQVPDLPNGDHEVIVTAFGVSSPTGALITIQR